MDAHEISCTHCGAIGGQHCACCGTWIRGLGITIAGRKYGKRCAALIKTARAYRKISIAQPGSLVATVHAPAFAEKHPHTWAHVVATMEK